MTDEGMRRKKKSEKEDETIVGRECDGDGDNRTDRENSREVIVGEGRMERREEKKREDSDQAWLVQDVLRLGAEVVPDWTPLSLGSFEQV